jgi:hypothetical protein
MVALVERMLRKTGTPPVFGAKTVASLFSEARTAPDKTAIERQIAATDKQIDQLVYELCGLTEEGIRTVEGERGGRTRNSGRAPVLPKRTNGSLGRETVELTENKGKGQPDFLDCSGRAL